jgi:hydrogenase expression/formation protein HypC
MCLAIPGKIESIIIEDPLMRSGKVSFGGILKEVNLAYTPEAQIGDYVIVHAGFALNRLDEAEALKTLEFLNSLTQPEEKA